MYRTAILSEKVKVKLVNGFSVPLTLKGAGMDGGDVKVQLSVGRLGAWCGQEESSQVMFSWFPRQVGLLDLETQTKDGTPLPVADYGEAALIPAKAWMVPLSGAGRQEGGGT